MSTHRRAWTVRAGIIAVAAAASLFGLASPAQAADGVRFFPTSYSFGPGGEQTVTVYVKNESAGTANVDLQLTINGEAAADLAIVAKPSGCTGGDDSVSCAAVSQQQGEKPYQFKVRAANPVSGNPGQEKGGNLAATANINGGPDLNASANVSVQVPEPAAVVPSVSGEVVNVFDAKPVPAATVYLQDSASPPHEYQTGTDKDGKFTFTSTSAKPIVPGTIALRVEKAGWVTYDKAFVTTAGQAFTTARLTITPENATASATPSAIPTDTGVTPTLGDDSLAGTPNEEESGISWVLIGIGGLLVLLGIGAIVLLFLRGRGDGAPDDDDRPAPRRGGPTRVPPARGGVRPPPPGRRPPDRTTVMRGPGPGNDPTRAMRPPVSPGPRGADQTMIARSPLADVPTMMHGRVPEPPDPYAPPGRPGPGPGPGPYGAAGGYAPPAGYGAPPPAGPAPGYPAGAGYPPGGYPSADTYGGQPAYGQPYGDAYSGPGPAHQQGYSGPPGPPGPPPGGYGYDQPGHAPDGSDPRGPRPAQPPHQVDRNLDWLD